MLCTPCSPDRSRPSTRALVVVSQLGRADEIQHRQLARVAGAAERGEIVVAAQHTSQDVGGLRGGDVEDEDGTEPDQVDEHRLPVAPVAAVSGMLGHVGVHDETVRRSVAEPLGLIGLNLTEDLPATR